jgi:hypothetical protein
MSDSSVSLLHGGARFNRAYEIMLGNTDGCSKGMTRISECILLAVLVIGILGVTGVFPSGKFTWTIVALGGGYMLFKFLGGAPVRRKIDLISSAPVTALIVSLGILAIVGPLPNLYMHYALIGTVTLTALVSLGMRIYARCARDAQKKNRPLA